MPTHCLISFGSNLGDRDAVVAKAARLIDQSGVVARGHPCSTMPDALPGFASEGLRTSRLFETPPIGGPGGQSPFLNAVAAFVTHASAAEVLDVLQQTEHELGRQRKDRWSARSIDLDVVLHGRLLGASAAGRRGLIGGRGPAGSARALVVPHPRYTARKFVVVPACDVAADFCDPRFGWTMRQLANHLDQSPPSMALTGGDEDLRQTICRRLAEEHSIQIVDARSLAENDPVTIQEANMNEPWISPTVPRCLQDPAMEYTATMDAVQASRLPRLIARIDRITEATRWPAPHRMWPSGWRWPEYRLEVDDLDWAIGEIASGLDSMRCEATPVTDNGNWWQS
ncbi:2-amino-4-hydroxy-6-hydroxymethyldihydropteridine diphosphokinase [Neorhodopirellula pilleata]|uniref:2-amino-4-hydroxy-6-hydroxymethyldihydropteridine pyrophosphokinase n=1 Tax=Neorhodopirellula pilleata TaxID=2714738 RepID=A0A5C6A7V4_9BACT|nr:2-amino-4-hydroxy-6-hydroxymethyldihydropteridine diphosphokinase [Neorhodopirellula pilleata]TWT95467.1 2-amino-4-hydroxy-6-hydroxymethyldihydropteridine pyrophosphokinase [Neorhodopirellula pilleata]